MGLGDSGRLPGDASPLARLASGERENGQGRERDWPVQRERLASVERKTGQQRMAAMQERVYESVECFLKCPP